jgi:hypothetical protein
MGPDQTGLGTDSGPEALSTHYRFSRKLGKHVSFERLGELAGDAGAEVILPMNEFTRRTMINLDIALEEVCRSLPHGGDHETRRKIAQQLLDSVMLGTTQRSALTEVARAALAEETKMSA